MTTGSLNHALQLPSYWDAAKQHLRTQDPALGNLIEAYHGEEGLQNRGDPFQTLIRAIVGQQISVQAAAAVWQRLISACAINPASLKKAPPEKLAACGLSGRKVQYIQGIATAFATESMVFDHLSAKSDAEIIQHLTQLPGVGRWTAEMFLIFALQRPDVLPLADLGLLKGFEKHYQQPRSDIEQHATIWAPYRTVATWYLWRKLDPEVVAY